MTEIAGRAAFVTGGGSGIGRGLANGLAAAGASVAVADILFENAQMVAGEINGAGGQALAVHCDVCDRGSIAAAKAAANAALGPIALLFANAGASNLERIDEIADETVDWLVEVNFTGVVNCMKAFLPDMIAAREGHVVATASTAGLFPNWVPIHCLYAGAKLGVVGLMLNVRMELAEFNVGATVYCPGGVATSMKNAELYRPAKFGGPRQAPVDATRSFKNIELHFLTPDQIAPIVLRAVRDNRPVVLDHSDQRGLFQAYVDVVDQAFDDIATYERENPEAVKTQVFRP